VSELVCKSMEFLALQFAIKKVEIKKIQKKDLKVEERPFFRFLVGC
jgi:predicted metal-binding protein